MRLFIAIQFSREIKTALLGAITELRAQAHSGSFTREENLHLTLAFIGETEKTAIIRQIMDSTEMSPFEMTVCDAGSFDGALYWAGIEKNPTLVHLAESLRAALRANGFEIETRAFKPHITLVRQLQAEGPVTFSILRTAMTVTRLSLMKSERINGRLVYTEIYGRDL